MIQKIKDLMRIKQEIDALSQAFSSQKKATEEFSQTIMVMKNEIESLKATQKEMTESFSKDIVSIQEAREEFHKEISDFKLVKSRLEKKLAESFEQEIKEFLLPKLERLDKSIKEFEEMSGRSSAINNSFLKLSAEISKFIAISEHIKQGDFELRKFANQLQEANKEKLDLMRKIDSLERLVSAMRRKAPMQKARF